MRSITNQIWCIMLVTALGLFYGCGPKVRVPPNIDLQSYQDIGLIDFSCNAQGNLGTFVTQKFLQSIQSAQPGVRVLELGSSDQVLSAVGHDKVNADAIRAIGEKYSVDAVITGHMEVSEVKPKMQLSSVLESMKVSADVLAALTARLVETEKGATRWTNTADRKETVAQVSLVSNGPAYFNASDPDQAYGKLVHQLVKRITGDFRHRYVRK